MKIKLYYIKNFRGVLPSNMFFYYDMILGYEFLKLLNNFDTTVSCSSDTAGCCVWFLWNAYSTKSRSKCNEITYFRKPGEI